MKMALLVVSTMGMAGWPAVVTGQAAASGSFAPDGAPERPPVRVDAGGACVVDLVQDYTIDGALTGTLRFDYRILVRGPCGAPAGTFDEEWIAHGSSTGSALGQSAVASVLYTAHVGAGGSVNGTATLCGGVQGRIKVTGALAERRLSYDGFVGLPQDGGI